METGAILDSQISASSKDNANYATKQGRLHLLALSGAKGGDKRSLLYRYLAVFSTEPD